MISVTRIVIALVVGIPLLLVVAVAAFYSGVRS